MIPIVPTPPPDRRCETRGCDHGPVAPRFVAGALDQSFSPLAGFVFACLCGWKRTEPVRAP